MKTDEVIPIPKIVCEWLEQMEKLNWTVEQRKMAGKLLYSFTKEMDPNFKKDMKCPAKNQSVS